MGTKLLYFTLLLAILNQASLASLQGQADLITAVKENDEARVRELLADGSASVDATLETDQYQWTALHWAARMGFAGMAKLLLEKGANVSAVAREDPDKEADKMPIHLAAQLGHTEVVRVLLDHKADVNARMADGLTPLHAAVFADQFDVARLLLERGANASAVCRFADDPAWVPPSSTALQAAAKKGNTRMIQLLLDQGHADVNQADHYGMTPLHKAVSDAAPVDTVKLFLDHGANANARARLSTDSVLIPATLTPLHFLGVAGGDVRIARLLVQHGADVNAEDYSGFTPLHFAANWDRPELARFLVESGARLSEKAAQHKDPLGTAAYQTPLVTALKGAHHAAAMAILSSAKNGSALDINAVEQFGQTALIWAAAAGDVEAVERLLELGADTEMRAEDALNATDSWTPLHIAAKLGKNAVVQVLLDKGKARLEAPDALNNTALSLAVQYAPASTVALLLDKGANPNAKSKVNFTEPTPTITPLDWAAAKNLQEETQLLLKHGARVNDQDYNGWTALHNAAKVNGAVVARLLIDAGANLSSRGIWVGDPTNIEPHVTPLHVAALTGSADVIRLIVGVLRNANRMEEIDAPGHYGLTALLYAVMNDRLEAAKALLEGGANVSHTYQVVNVDENRLVLSSPLIKAVKKANLDMIELLLGYGAEVNGEDGDGLTPLHWAVAGQNETIVKALLNRGADAKVDLKQLEHRQQKANNRQNILQMAARRGSVDVLQLLLDNGANNPKLINAQDSDGWSALHYAAAGEANQAVIARILVDSGANCELRSKDGRTAAEVAEQNLRDEAAQVLNGCRKHVEEEAVEGEGGAKNKTMKTNTTGEFQ